MSRDNRLVVVSALAVLAVITAMILGGVIAARNADAAGPSRCAAKIYLLHGGKWKGGPVWDYYGGRKRILARSWSQLPPEFNGRTCRITF